MRIVFYGHWKIALYSAGFLIGTIDYPVGNQGPIETPASHAFAEAWRQGQTVDVLQKQFPKVTYRPNQ